MIFPYTIVDFPYKCIWHILRSTIFIIIALFISIISYIFIIFFFRFKLVAIIGKTPLPSIPFDILLVEQIFWCWHRVCLLLRPLLQIGQKYDGILQGFCRMLCLSRSLLTLKCLPQLLQNNMVILWQLNGKWSRVTAVYAFILL